MNDQVDDLLSDWLDDADNYVAKGVKPFAQLPDDETATEATEAIAQSLLIHGLLTDIGSRDDDAETEQIHAVMQRIDFETTAAKVARVFGSMPRRPKLVTTFATLLTVAAGLMVMFVVFGPHRNVSAATASLEKVVAAAARPFDRTYKVRLVEEYPRDKRPRKMSHEDWGREAPEQIDGATIYVRSANQYVMTVLLKTGVIRTSGCDGQVSWSFREDGPVHVSTNLNRFRGGMPGNQQDMPFLNIHANLSQLRIGYDIELSDERDTASDGSELARLICLRKPDVARGIKQFDIWFDPESGTVHKMQLDGLPRGRGGPKSVVLELVDQSELAADFFSHAAHHEPGRRVKRE